MQRPGATSARNIASEIWPKSLENDHVASDHPKVCWTWRPSPDGKDSEAILPTSATAWTGQLLVWTVGGRQTVAGVWSQWTVRTCSNAVVGYAAPKWWEGQLWSTLSFAPLHSHGWKVQWSVMSVAALVKKMLTITKGEVIWEVAAATTPLLLLISTQKQLQQSIQSSVPVHKAKGKPGPSLFTDHYYRPGLREDAPTPALK